MAEDGTPTPKRTGFRPAGVPADAKPMTFRVPPNWDELTSEQQDAWADAVTDKLCPDLKPR